MLQLVPLYPAAQTHLPLTQVPPLRQSGLQVAAIQPKENLQFLKLDNTLTRVDDGGLVHTVSFSTSKPFSMFYSVTEISFDSLEYILLRK